MSSKQTEAALAGHRRVPSRTHGINGRKRHWGGARDMRRLTKLKQKWVPMVVQSLPGQSRGDPRALLRADGETLAFFCGAPASGPPRS
eukprot:7597283-Pyramimonas_sp.AAC.1